MRVALSEHSHLSVLHTLHYGSRNTCTLCSTASQNKSANSQCRYTHLDKSCYNNRAHAHWHASTILWEATLSHICSVWVWLGYRVAEWTSRMYPIRTWSAQACLSQTSWKIAVDGIFRSEGCSIGGETVLWLRQSLRDCNSHMFSPFQSWYDQVESSRIAKSS
jgi:hypothetical protein